MSSPHQVIIFGASGDLALRKLLPALTGIVRSGQFAREFSVIGVSRRPKSNDEYRSEIRERLPENLREAFDGLAPRVHYRSGDVMELEDMKALKSFLDAEPGGDKAGRLFYLSLKPDLFEPALERMHQAGLIHRQARNDCEAAEGSVRVIVEKPFGHDLPSARQLNLALHQTLAEEQIYRIDHYLGKETVQNILGLRFHNAIFEPVWNRNHVEAIQVTVAETLGMEDGRGAYYDTAGAVRDMLQNHMLQVLALVTMDPPASLDADNVRGQKVNVLKSLKILEADKLIRARYAKGELNGETVPGYLDEQGVAGDSNTETYVAVRAAIDNWRWSGVPILLRHGKRMPKKFTEVEVQFRTPPLQLFNRPPEMLEAEYQRALREGLLCQVRPNALKISIQPRETISLTFGVKRPGAGMVMSPAHLDFDYAEHFGSETTPAYQRLLLDALNGDATLFLRADEIEASWQFADTILGKFNKSPEGPPMHEYPAGSWGPDAADELFSGCEGGWSLG
jgi:glucose-6-phosphate 1-dehydrogenase